MVGVGVGVVVGVFEGVGVLVTVGVIVGVFVQAAVCAVTGKASSSSEGAQAPASRIASIGISKIRRSICFPPDCTVDLLFLKPGTSFGDSLQIPGRATQ